MASAPAKAFAAEKAIAAGRCPHCKGELEVLGQGRNGVEITRCRSCGREPGSINIPANFVGSPGSAPRPCRVDGCPGTLDSAGRCACCEKRAAWEQQHRPRRVCAICGGGPLVGRAIKFCAPCKKARARVGYSAVGVLKPRSTKA